MEVNYESGSVHLLNNLNTQTKHNDTRRIKRSKNTHETIKSNNKFNIKPKSNNDNWIKTDNYRNQYKMITDSLLKEIKKIVPEQWKNIERRILLGERLKLEDIVIELLSPFSFNALEVLMTSKMTGVLNKTVTNGVSDSTVRSALCQRLRQEMEMWDPANDKQVAGISSLLKTYNLINCDLTKLVLIQLNPQFTALHLSKEKLRFAFRKLKIIMTWTDIELSHMIANTVIPKNTQQWYEKNKALFSDKSMKSVDFDFRLKNSGPPSEMTVEQLQKLLLRDARHDLTCSLIALYATQSGIKLALYDRHTAILKEDEPHHEPKVNADPASECETNPSLVQLPETSLSLPVQTSAPDMKTQFCWFADPTTQSTTVMLKSVPYMDTFDYVLGEMVHTPAADALQRSKDFARQFLLDREG
ncbi:hypothetical protein L579_1320 [Pantoea sp. AS-PWVM4]|uniref:hypothetical protein n=1 Tax=Pantoea sp. AS-PWVM4 TaxID=1332069 RepID=UPI0003AC7D67|nr:hypothetical protein [Pantoea sp. AS-PWVM4]ERK09537.1 hypothetical protein L579_1320 [Pantoea sp. AS-PWVM4]